MGCVIVYVGNTFNPNYVGGGAFLVIRERFFPLLPLFDIFYLNYLSFLLYFLSFYAFWGGVGGKIDLFWLLCTNFFARDAVFAIMCACDLCVFLFG